MPGTKTINVTRSTYIKSDGLRAFYASGQSYLDVSSLRMVECVGAEAVTWKTDSKGNRILGAYYEGVWLRVSDDNGLHWTDRGPKFRFDPDATEEQIFPAGFSLDEKTNTLIRLYIGKKADKSCYGYVNQGTYRAFYSISIDQGATWTDPAQIVDMRKGYDADSWGPGLMYGERGGYPHACVWMDDGSLVVPFTIYERLDGRPWFFRVICARGRWKKDMSGIDWVFGDQIEVPLQKSLCGCCEPTLATLGGDRLFIVTRCQGGTPDVLKEVAKRWRREIALRSETGPGSDQVRALEALCDTGEGMYSTRYCAYSEDGGMTWSEPEPLEYDDGGTVWTPASYSAFFESSKTGKLYWLANILEKPVFGQEPRYPLTIAEFDREKRSIIRDSIQVIQDKPEGANEHVRYTNFGHYEDRETGNLVITLPEQYRYVGWDELKKPEDFAADCLKYVVEFL